MGYMLSHESQQLLNLEGNISLQMSQKADYIHLSVKPPKEGPQIPSDIVCVLDSSGSMDTEATVKNSEGIKESQGYTLLDILKHAVKTVIANLSENDRFSLVNFSCSANQQFSLNYMNEKQKKYANQALEKIQSTGSTNLWDGLLKGSQILRNSGNPNSQKVIILLTDGEPNINPSEGIIQAFKNYLSKSDFNYIVHTLALGKQMNSALLTQLAIMGQGQFSFIPCAGFMGTIFVNTLSNILCTCASNASIALQPKQGVNIVEVVGYDNEENKNIIKLGDIKYGQTQDIIIKFTTDESIDVNIDDLTKLIDAKLYYNDFQHKTLSVCSAEQCSATPMLDYHLCRLTLIENINQALSITKNDTSQLALTKDSISKVSTLIATKLQEQEQQLEEIDLDQQENDPLSTSVEYLKNIQQDINGEITLAFCKHEWFYQWGQHYIPSLLMCHQKQTCNNFKDPGIKLYGGEVFKRIRQKIEDTFLNLPPPKPLKTPSKAQYQPPIPSQPSIPSQPQQQSNYQPPKQDFSVYYDAGGGCFASWSQVLLADGRTLPINQLSKGDILQTRDLHNKPSTSAIKAVVEIQIEPTKPVNLVSLNQQIALTPKHPLWQNGWVKPSQIHLPVQFNNISQLFNLVLERDHQVMVGGIWCLTLAHQINQQFAYHKYFATEKVIQDLQKIEGWEQGKVILQNQQFIRNTEDGAICSISLPQQQ